MFPYFEVFGRTIGSYAVCAAVGLLLCGFVAAFLAKRYKVAYEDIILVMVTIGISLLIGGHLLYGITNLKNVIALVQEASSYSLREIVAKLGQYFGGMVYYGGFIGGCIGLALYTKFSKELSRKVVFDLFAVCIPLFHVFGRIGCFLSGCCYGIESSWGFVAHGNTVVPELNDVMRMPVPLMEAACNLLIFIVLLSIFLKGKKEGELIWYYMLIYPVVRFVLEFFRGDAIRGFLFGLSTSQWISIILFCIAVFKLFLWKGKKGSKAVCAALLLGVLAVTGSDVKVTYAAEAAVADTVEQTEAKEEDTVTEDVQVTDGQTEESTAEEQTQVGIQLRPVTMKEKFVLFVCFLFAVTICIIVVIWGDPRERERMRNKKLRKQLAEEAARKAAREERLRKQAEEARLREQEEANKAETEEQTNKGV